MALQKSRTDPGLRPIDLVRAGAILLVVLAISFLGFSRTLPPTADEMIDFSLAESLAKWGTFSIDQVSTVGPNPEEFGLGGHRYSKYGPLQAVLSVPLYALAEHLPIGATDTVLLLNHLVTALAAALLYLLVRRLGYGPGVALAMAAIAVFGTPLWVDAKRYLAEPTIALALLATLYAAYSAATTGRPGWAILAGVAFGLAVAAKYIDAVLLAPVPLYLAFCAARRAPAAAAKALVWFGIGVAPVAVLLLLYNLARFGNPLETGYAHWEGFSTPVWQGLTGFLFSPGKSLFVYTPLFLLLPFWGGRFVRRFPSFSALLGVIVALHLVVYGAWWVWWGAWTWGPRFIVPILPLLAIGLSEGLARAFARLDWRIGVVAVLGVLSLGIQVLGIAVDHTIYMAQLLPINPRPDTLTLWDLRYSPILHQIPLLTRQYLDFGWIERSGPSPVNPTALAPSLLGVGAAILAFLLIWRMRTVRLAAPVLLVSALVLGFGVYRTLRAYDQTADPDIARITAAIDAAPANVAVVQLIPDDVVPFANWQKRPLPELGWIEEPKPNPIITRRLDDVASRSAQLWVVTEAPRKAPSNGIEARLDRSLALVSEEPIGRFRLLRYATRPAALPIVPLDRQFAGGLSLVGYVASRPPTPGGSFDLVLAWRSGVVERPRPDYTVFVHLVDAQGKLIAQHDDPPAEGYAPTSQWTDRQSVYDDHTIVVPGDAPAGLHLVQVGLYLPSNGQRLPLLGADGKPAGDTVTIDLEQFALALGPALTRERPARDVPDRPFTAAVRKTALQSAVGEMPVASPGAPFGSPLSRPGPRGTPRPAGEEGR